MINSRRRCDMKKVIALAVALVFIAISLFAVPVYAEDNVFDKVGDWWATIGKDEPQKSMILTQRKAERAANRAGKEMEKSAQHMEKGIKDIIGK
jgi:hypothetical protein